MTELELANNLELTGEAIRGHVTNCCYSPRFHHNIQELLTKLKADIAAYELEESRK